MQKIIPLLGRICLSAIFLMSGFFKITDFAGTQANMETIGFPIVRLFLIGAIVFEIVGALLILIGFKARWGALILIIFLVPTTIIFHTEFSDKLQMIMFMKNLAILGGLLMIANFGAGGLSLDSRNNS